MKKAIFLDIDGTLTSKRNDVSEKVVYAIQEARKNGHKVFICTGRNLAGIQNLSFLDFDGFILSAGAYIVIDDKVIHHEYMSDEKVKHIRQILDEHHVLYHIEATNQTYGHEEMTKHFELMMSKNGDMNSEAKRMAEMFSVVPLEEFDRHPEPIHKICFLSYDKNIVDKIAPALENDYAIVIHTLFDNDDVNGEFIPLQFNKGKAIQRVVDYLGISMEDTIGFGDSMNDYEMIRTCHDGIVMANGSEQLKQYASAICESVDEDGIYHEFKRRHLI